MGAPRRTPVERLALLGQLGVPDDLLFGLDLAELDLADGQRVVVLRAVQDADQQRRPPASLAGEEGRVRTDHAGEERRVRTDHRPVWREEEGCVRNHRSAWEGGGRRDTLETVPHGSTRGKLPTCQVECHFNIIF